MDVREVLQRARAEAGLDQRRLAARAGTARTTVVAYESGARSPTVRQLTRLLAACGLQARVVLEPLSADVDRLLDAASSGPPPRAFVSLDRAAASLTAAGVRWALDGWSAVAAHGLALPHDDLGVVLPDEPSSRAWLRSVWAKGWDRHGFSLAPNWYEDPDTVRLYVRRPVHTVVGMVQLRFAEPDAVEHARVSVCGMDVPVLPLPAVRQAHPSLREVLDRHAERGRTSPPEP